MNEIWVGGRVVKEISHVSSLYEREFIERETGFSLSEEEKMWIIRSLILGMLNLRYIQVWLTN